MRLLPVLLAAAASVYAADSSLETMIIDSLHQVVVLTQNVTGEISELDGNSKNGLTQAVAIQTSTTDLVNYIGNATMKVQNSPEDLSSGAAQTLGPYTQGLAYTVNGSIATLIKKKPDFEKLGIASLVTTSLQMQLNSSVKFSGAILDKIPENLQPVAAALSGQINRSIQQGIDCFNGKNETCNTAIANSTRTLDAAQDTGAIPKSGADRTMGVAGSVVVLGAAFVAFAVGV